MLHPQPVGVKRGVTDKLHPPEEPVGVPRVGLGLRFVQAHTSLFFLHDFFVRFVSNKVVVFFE
jgi:hypothetical protein